MGAATDIVRDMLAATVQRLDWERWTRPFFGPLGGLRESVRQIDQALTVAATHPCDAVRGVRLEMAERSISAARSDLDELELAVAQAREALKRESAGS